jgi:hypothetical protein
MALAQRGRHDQLGQRSAEGLLAAVAKRALRGRVELDNAAGGVGNDDTVERRLQVGAYGESAGGMERARLSQREPPKIGRKLCGS